jgi:signal transduction histidine kinase
VSSDDESALPLFNRSTSVSIAVLTVAVLGSCLSVTARRDVPLVIAVHAIYALFAVIGLACAERRSPWAQTAVLVVLALLGGVVTWLSGLVGMLIYMPVLSATLLLFSTRAAVLAMLPLTALLLAGGYHWHNSPQNFLRIGAGFIASSVFVILFSRLMKRERLAQLQLRQSSARIEELATANERNRIAREIHDSLGHHLMAMHVHLEAAHALVGRDAVAELDCLARMRESLRQGLEDLRRSVSMLRAQPLDGRPFAVAVAALVEDCRAAGVDAQLSVSGQPRTLSPAVEFALYRVAQEALTNVRRHARAASVAIGLRYESAAVELAVDDDGIGAGPSAGGVGLTGVRERVDLLGGQVSIDTAIGRGFKLRARVPA